MTTSATAPQNTSLKEWINIIVSLLALGKAIYDLLNNSPYYVFLIGLIIFIVSAIYYLHGLYQKQKYKLLSGISIAFYVFSLALALGGGWYYFTQYDPEGTPIEKFNTHVLPYESGTDVSQDLSWADLSFYSTSEIYHPILSYQVDFGIPMQGGGWAGFYIDFKQPIDLSKYTNIRFQIQYGCDEDKIMVILKDNARNEFGVLLDQNYVKGKYTDKQLVTIPLETFVSVTLDHIKNITFHADSSFVRGEHWVIISGVHFAR